MKNIINVFKSELYKISKSKGGIKLIIFLSVAPVFMIISSVMSAFNNKLTVFEGKEALLVADSFWFPIVAGIFIAGCIGNDYANEGIKQIVSSGIKRKHFILGQWLAQFVFLMSTALILGGFYCLLLSVVSGYGTFSFTAVAMTIFGEALTTGLLIAFIQLLMHLTRSNGLTTSVTMFVFVISNFVINMLLEYVKLGFLQKFWLPTVLDNALNTANSLSTQVYNLFGVLFYLIVFLFISVNVFKRKQI